MSQAIYQNIAEAYNLLHIRVVMLFSGSFSGSSRTAFPVNRLLFVRKAGTGGLIEDNNQSYQVEPNMVYFLPQGHPIHLEFNDSIQYTSIHFSVEPYPGIELFTNYDHLTVRKDSAAVGAAELLFTDPSPLHGALRLSSFLTNTLVEMFPILPSQQHEAEHKWKLFRPVFQCLADPNQESFRITELAAAMNMRRDVFTHKFIREFGVSPKKFLNDLLFRKASELMLTPKMTSREAAALLGFKDEFYFSRFFKKHAGISPRRYAQGTIL